MKRTLLVFMSILLLSSCLGNDNNNNTCSNTLKNYPNFYDIQNISANALLYEAAGATYYRWSRHSPILANQIIDANLFILELAATSTVSVVKNKRHNLIDFSPINSAIACTPTPPSTYEVISKLTITSDADFNQDYPAGSNLNKLFLVKYTVGSGVSSNYQGFNFNTESINVDDFVVANPPGMSTIHMMLSAIPVLSKIHNFKIVYMHSDGEYFEIFLNTVEFN